jgi:hypothetical protein
VILRAAGTLPNLAAPYPAQFLRALGVTCVAIAFVDLSI